MIIRIKGAQAGIKDYLEKGQMKDRFFDRDTLDHRQLLMGNLEEVDNIINQIDNNGEKYFHITLAFKEDKIDNDILKNITQEFRDYYFQSYNNDEVSFYAEAHLPKLKSYYDKHDELVTRKPHIHIVVPKINVATGDTISFQERYNIKYVDAFQEYINCKYGLASPKDNPRMGFNKKSEMISRYKGDEFTGVGKLYKTKIFNEIISQNIQTRSDLVTFLEDSGYKVRIREVQNSDKVYINIKHPNDKKGVNLKEFVFSDDYLSLSKSDKLKFADNKKQLNNKTREELLGYISKTNYEHQAYISRGYSRTVPEKYINDMETWSTLISDQRKYVDRKLSKRQMAEYKNLSLDKKIDFLQESKNKFYTNIGAQQYDGKSITNRNELSSIYRRTAANNLQSAGTNLAIFTNNCERLERDKVSDVEGIWRWQLGQEYARTIGVSKGRHITDTGVSEGNRPVSRLDALSLDYINEQLSNSEYKDEITYLRTHVRGDVLLELVEKTHGVIPEKYTITSNPSGEDRIKVGDKNLSVIDFCRQELNLNITDTVKLLRATNLMQLDVDRERGWSYTDNKYLSTEYQSWLKNFKQQKDKELTELKSTVSQKFNVIKEQYQAKVQNIKHEYMKSKADKDKAISTLKMDRLLENRALYTARNKELDNIKSKYNLDMQESYRTFLAEMATNGDNKALLELRRLRINFEEYQKTGSIKHVDRYEEFKLNITHKIDINGIITYYLNNNEIVKDTGKRIDLLSTTDKDISKLAFDLAISKFGNNLELHGSDEFKRTMVDLAITNNYKVTFKDEYSKSYHAQKVNELKAHHEKISSLSGEFFKDNISKTDGLLVTNIESTKAIDDNGKCYTTNVITILDVNKQTSYELSSKQIDALINYNKLNIGDVISIDASKQNEIEIDKNYWTKYTTDLSQGVLISDYMHDNQLIFELPEHKQIKYPQEYFKIQKEGIADKLKEIGYEHGDLVSIKPIVNDKKNAIDYSFEIISDGQYKKQAKIEVRENDIQEAKISMQVGDNQLSKVLVGEVVEFGNGEFKGKNSTYITLKHENGYKHQYWNSNFSQLIDSKQVQTGKQYVIAKTHDKITEHVESRNNFISHKFDYKSMQEEKISAIENIKNKYNKNELQNTYAGVIVDIGKKPYNEKSLNNSYYVTIKDINGHEKTLWGRGVEHIINKEKLTVGEGVLFAIVEKQTFESGITQNTYAVERLPEFEKIYKSSVEVNKSNQVTRQSYGEVLEVNTITKNGEKIHLIKIDVGGHTLSYWDNNLPITDIKKGDGLYIAQSGKIDVTVQTKHAQFAAKEICQDLNIRSSRLVQQKERETQRKELDTGLSM